MCKVVDESLTFLQIKFIIWCWSYEPILRNRVTKILVKIFFSASFPSGKCKYIFCAESRNIFFATFPP